MMRRVLALAVALALPAAAQLSPADIEAARVQGAKAGWTFTVGRTSATQQSLDALCGLVAPKDWHLDATFQSFGEKAVLPAAFDWRPYCPPVRSQGACGSCWAFGTVGVLECLIGIKDGLTVDLSEQWLVSCNTEEEVPELLGEGEGGGTWGCNGGWFAHDYHAWKGDPCGGFGAVRETAFPYEAEDLPCDCPYPHVYTIDSWAYVEGADSMPSADALKQAIFTYGPVSVAVSVGEEFGMYTGGVFNVDITGEEVNHAVVLVGWDDSLGEKGAWILRNSWGGNWGYSGYMYIAYGCSQVGYGACFATYSGTGSTAPPVIISPPVGGWVEEDKSLRLRVEASGVGQLHYQWRRDDDPVGDDADTYTITQVQFDDAGLYSCEVSDMRGTTTTDPVLIEVLPDEAVSALLLPTLLLLALALGGLSAISMRRRSVVG